jgi:hypothetical protein
MGWATFWATFLQTHLVALVADNVSKPRLSPKASHVVMNYQNNRNFNPEK